VRPPAVVPAFKFAAQVGQMINTLDDGYPLKPFVFEGLVDSFGSGCLSVSFGSLFEEW